MEDSVETTEGTHRGPDGQKWSREEWLFFGIGIDLLLVWAVITWIFGYGGFILVALGLVAAAFAALVLISRG